MELLLLLAADYASVDASGKLNILGAFRTIYAQQFPARHELMHLVVKLRPALGEIGDTRTLRITLVDEDGNEHLEVKSEFSIPTAAGLRPEFNAVIGIRDLVFPKAGTYEFRLFVDREQKGEIQIDVVERPQSAD